jgi:thiamine-phosphate pyrophosphorylase
LEQIFKLHSPTIACFRRVDRGWKEEEGELFLIKTAQLGGIPILHIRNLAPRLLEIAEGVHLSSSHLHLIPKFKEMGKLVIASTHSVDEVERARGADFITFSPIFDSKGRKGLGVEVLKEVARLHPYVLALGGIDTPEKVAQIESSPACGFGAIRYFHRGVDTIQKGRG